MVSLEAVVNTPTTFMVSGPNTNPLADGVLYLNGAASGITPTVTQIGVTNAWKVTFTPTSTGVFSYYAFGAIQVQVQAVTKSLYSFLANIEDEALGSWSWNKTTGVLTVLRQSGTVLATHEVIDTSTTASRERVS